MDHPLIEQQITFLYTHNLASTTHFYEDIMGFELKLDQGACRIFEVTQNSFVGFCHNEHATKEHPDVIFTLVTHEVDEWYSSLKNQGVEFEKPPAVNPNYNIYHCYLRDPNGYLIEIQKFLDPRW